MSQCLVHIRFRLGWVHQGNTNIVATYIGIPVFFILYGIWKVVKKTKFIPYSDMDFQTGRSQPPSDEEIAALDELERTDVKLWEELDARGRALKVGRAVHRVFF
ncbi:hypothetical protein BOTCAL_0494g00040 [Botryotinia calthae]|uniref:Amino acid permease/ SLC12A domain-containing protein n=1 Tax=Botryotinia calthae TaxID=38488 RepID=A0A4Y8CNC8_9HELO|nr:hypothetical protein BOTCAL_0494g00040 [Botryotinia calthae]